MQAQITEPETCSVYCGRGDRPQLVTLPGFPDNLKVHRISASGVPLHQIMSRKLICAREDLDVAVVVGLMIRHHIGCIPVVDERQHPIGMITKSDVIEQIDATMSSVNNGYPLPEDLQARCADEVMMPLAFTLPESASVAHAAALMMSEDTHHVIVVNGSGQISGVVSSRDIVAWLLESDGP